MGTFITGLFLVGMIYVIIRYMIKQKKNGKSLQCGCDCKKCSGNCH